MINEVKSGVVVGNKKILSLHTKEGSFERWKCRCLHCGKTQYYTRVYLEKIKHENRCTACRENNCPSFSSFKGGW